MMKLLKTILIMTIVATTTPAEGQKGNPLLQDWKTPHQTPPFSKIKNKHFEPAVKEGIKQAEANIKAITNNAEAPTFENTIVALETSQELLSRVTALLFNLNECNTNAELQKIVLKVSPELTRFESSVSMNAKLFARVKTLYDKRAALGLTADQMKLLEDTYLGFVRNGVNLGEDEQKAFAKNQERLSELTQRFNQNVLADNNSYTLHVTDKGQLGGLPENVLAAAREEAQKRKLEGYVFTLAYPSFGPFMTYADNQELREQMWRAYNSRGNRGGETDNNDLIRQITALRLEQAKLLGYSTYAEYVLSNRMVESPARLKKFQQDLYNACYPVAVKDLKAVTRYAKENGQIKRLYRWDVSYWTEKLKQEQYNFDEEQLRPYFQLEKVRQGIFDLYGRLYGLTFKENSDIEVYHPDVKAFEVSDGGKFMGVLYLDMHPRESKRSGAWMTEFRDQNGIKGHEHRPLIQVVCNFSKPVGDKPALLSFDEVETFMHEFGHAMHGMLSEVTYPSQSGTNVYRDFVELPSQIMENWCYETEFLNTFARHYKTGELIPAEYIKKIRECQNYMAGYYCLRQLSLGMVDFAFHSITEPIEGKIENFEQAHMVELIAPVEGCNTSTAFTHIFAGGYASGYYGYKWAEVLDADAFSQFKQNGIFDKATATRFRNEVLSKGGTAHPAQLYRNFMGREPDQNALLIRSGFILPMLIQK